MPLGASRYFLILFTSVIKCSPDHISNRFGVLQLHVGPRQYLKGQQGGIHALPENVKVEMVYTDFLRYIFKCVQYDFKTRIIDGDRIWDDISLESNIIILMTIPDGWDHAQIDFLRAVSSEAGMVSQQSVERNLKFVTENEASLHFALAYGYNDDGSRVKSLMKAADRFAMIISGSSTVEANLYAVKCSDPLALEKLCAGQTLQVSKRAYFNMQFPCYHCSNRS
jgi:hypothetical protein